MTAPTRRAALGALDAAFPATWKETGRQFIDPAVLPDSYGLLCAGNCLEPEIQDGTCLQFDRREKYAVGDFVAVYRRQEIVPAGQSSVLIKRVFMMHATRMKFPYREHPESEMHMLFGVETLNPPARFFYECQNILAVHKCMGPVPPDVKRHFMSDAEIAGLMPPPSAIAKQEA